MTRTAWMPFFFVLVTACGGDEGEEQTRCFMVPDGENEAIGDLAIHPSEGDPVFVEKITLESNGQISLEVGGARVQMSRPTVGSHDLASLGAELCSWHFDECVPVIGTIDVTIGEPTELDAIVHIEGMSEEHEELTIRGTSRLVYRESAHRQCSTTYAGGSNGCQGLGFGPR